MKEIETGDNIHALFLIIAILIGAGFFYFTNSERETYESQEKPKVETNEN